MRPDLIIRIPAKKQTFLLDLELAYDNEETFKLAREENKRKYVELVDVTTVRSLGSWDPVNNEILNRLGLMNHQIKDISSTFSVTSIKETHYMYLGHLLLGPSRRIGHPILSYLQMRKNKKSETDRRLDRSKETLWLRPTNHCLASAYLHHKQLLIFY